MKRKFIKMMFASTAMLVLLITAKNAFACALELSVNGSFFEVNYPGSIEVAVAVASARRDGIIPPASIEPASNMARLQNMLADLKRLRLRLVNGQGATDSFSLLLVGPGLWSNFYTSGNMILGQYHVSGPLANKSTVLTSDAVLRALLSDELGIHQAMELGLITYSGKNADAIRNTFERGFETNRQNI